MMCISLFSYGRPVVVRCKWVGLGMGWVGSVIWWVGLGWVDENRPTDNSVLAFLVRSYRFSSPAFWSEVG